MSHLLTRQIGILVIYGFCENLLKNMRSIIDDRLWEHHYIIEGLAVVIEKGIKKITVPFWLYLNKYCTDYYDVDGY